MERKKLIDQADKQLIFTILTPVSTAIVTYNRVARNKVFALTTLSDIKE